ncbi:hypothetical protein FOA52_002968 [Chlamydomonas sp. UWO 241]|nr:hypothetical protein FOA52_002968 [Chlamydomonas sp. UWO 241]
MFASATATPKESGSMRHRSFTAGTGQRLPARGLTRAAQRRPCRVDATAAAATGAAPLTKRLGFIGPGSMAEALARGFVSRGVVAADMVGCSGSKSGRNRVFEEFGAVAYDSNLELVEASDIIFVSVKPYNVVKVLEEVRPALTPRHTIVSVAAGVPISTLLRAAGPDTRVVRVMPNTPCLVGEVAAAMCLGGRADESDEAMVRAMFEAVGKIFTVTEVQLSAVTGVSGSGPAYIFMVIEAMADGGVKAGLPRHIAQALAAQTVLGSAKMVLETGKHPGALKDMVTSPGGTTIAGVHELEKAGLRAAFMNAVVAASNRAHELAGP